MMQLSTLVLSLVVLSTVKGGEKVVRVRTEKTVTSNCQKNVTLFCNTTSHLEHFNIVEISWINETGGILCSHPDTLDVQSSQGFHCQFRHHHRHDRHHHNHFTLTINSPRENHSGLYTCVLLTSHGHDYSNTSLSVSDCPRESSQNAVKRSSNQANISGSHWTCLVLLLPALLLPF